MNAVEIHEVTKSFGAHTAVADLTMAVPAGSIYGFIGPNGSGKTTTLRMIMRIIHPDRGRISVLGEESLGAAHDRIGYLPEERGLYKKMKVREVLRYFAELKNCRDIQQEIDRWLDIVQLADWRDKKVETLSKGMSQKVQFITAVIARPDLVILDEPFSGLDPVNAEVLRAAVLGLKRSGTTVIFSTHDMGMAEKMCDFIFMIFKGRKVLDGTLAEIQGRYGSDTVRVRLEGGANGDGPAEVSANGGPGLAKGGPDLTRIRGVERVTDFGRLQELRISRGADTQQILASLMQQGRVQHFELANPSLEDIFIRLAGPEASQLGREGESLHA